MKSKKVIIFSAAIFLLGGFFLASKMYKKFEADRLSFLGIENASLFVRDYSPQYGSKDAKVYLTEFLDPECESCRAFYPHVKNLLKEFDGKVKLVVRYAPFHRNSVHAIKALEASRKQNKYWEALELLFNTQPSWGDHHNPQPERIFEYLPRIGINIEKLKADMNDPAIDTMIAQENSDRNELKIRGTPTFFVNGKRLERFGIKHLREAIQREVTKAYN